MKPGTTNKAEGAIHVVKDAVKETVGHITNDVDLESEGQAEKIVGKVQKTNRAIESSSGKTATAAPCPVTRSRTIGPAGYANKRLTRYHPT
jgi:uncharacterized protein YjbJ (UPF0337 family)